MERLTRYELEVLRREAEPPGGPAPEWGSWVGACIETLRGMRLLDRQGRITEKGRERLAWELRNKPFAPRDEKQVY